MRENTNHDKSDMDNYGYRPYATVKKRLNLNDLLKKIDIQKKADKKKNLFILFGVISLFLIFYLSMSFFNLT